jgi:hypothetical protein
MLLFHQKTVQQKWVNIVKHRQWNQYRNAIISSKDGGAKNA